MSDAHLRVVPSGDDRPTSTVPRHGDGGLLTVRDVADRLRVSRTTVRRLIDRGELRAHAAGATYRITTDDLRAYLTGDTTS